MPSINNFLSGFTNGLPGMKDYQHASRLYIDDLYRLAPKRKFLFHVVFHVNIELLKKLNRKLDTDNFTELNMLVKSCELPKYDLNLEERKAYNKITYVGTRMAYRPINVVFHDDRADVVNAFWKAYYEYYFADGYNKINPADDTSKSVKHRQNYYYNTDPLVGKTQFGMDAFATQREPLIRGIDIFILQQKRFMSCHLGNPMIGAFSHDNLDQADGTGTMQNSMSIFYDSVVYNSGEINKGPDNIRGSNPVPTFAKIHYDFEPSPLSVLGGGTTSIFGPGGIVQGAGSVIGDIASGQVGVDTILRGINVYNNAKKIKAKDAAKEEIKSIVKDSILTTGRKSSSTVDNPIGSFTIGNVAKTALGLGVVAAGAKSYTDSQKVEQNTTVQNVIDTTKFLSPTESFNLLSTSEEAKTKVAIAIYHQKVGSSKGYTFSQSDVEYNSLDANQKNVYTSRALTDIIKLVTEGYVRIARENNDVVINTEKAVL